MERETPPYDANADYATRKQQVEHRKAVDPTFKIISDTFDTVLSEKSEGFTDLFTAHIMTLKYRLLNLKHVDQVVFLFPRHANRKLLIDCFLEAYKRLYSSGFYDNVTA